MEGKKGTSTSYLCTFLVDIESLSLHSTYSLELGSFLCFVLDFGLVEPSIPCSDKALKLAVPFPLHRIARGLSIH